MTFREFRSKWAGKDTLVYLTALAYRKVSKKYYSFRSLDWQKNIGDFTEENDKYVLDLEIECIGPFYRSSDDKLILYIDLIEWVDEDIDPEG